MSNKKAKPLETLVSTTPVYFKASDAPDGVTVPEICEAAESKIGHDRIAGAVRKGGLWRLHGKCPEDKAKLLSGVEPKIEIVRLIDENLDTQRYEKYEIPLHAKNPMSSTIGADGKVIPTIRLTIDGFLLSVSMEDVKKSLEKIKGLVMRSNIFFDRAWLKNKTLSRFVNGRRYVFIDEPSEENPLPQHIKVGAFQASLFYKGMPVRCWDCAGPHRKGDKSCKGKTNHSDQSSENTAAEGEQEEETTGSPCDSPVVPEAVAEMTEETSAAKAAVDASAANAAVDLLAANAADDLLAAKAADDLLAANAAVDLLAAKAADQILAANAADQILAANAAEESSAVESLAAKAALRALASKAAEGTAKATDAPVEREEESVESLLRKLRRTPQIDFGSNGGPMDSPKKVILVGSGDQYQNDNVESTFMLDNENVHVNENVNREVTLNLGGSMSAKPSGTINFGATGGVEDSGNPSDALSSIWDGDASMSGHNGNKDDDFSSDMKSDDDIESNDCISDGAMEPNDDMLSEDSMDSDDTLTGSAAGSDDSVISNDGSTSNDDIYSTPVVIMPNRPSGGVGHKCNDTEEREKLRCQTRCLKERLGSEPGADAMHSSQESEGTLGGDFMTEKAQPGFDPYTGDDSDESGERETKIKVKKYRKRVVKGKSSGQPPITSHFKSKVDNKRALSTSSSGGGNEFRRPSKNPKSNVLHHCGDGCACESGSQ